MTSRAWRYLLGPLFLAGAFAIVWFDRARPAPLISPLVLAALGIAAVVELLGMFQEQVPARLRRAAMISGSLFILAPVVLRLGEGSVDARWLLAAYPPLCLLILAVAWLSLRWKEGVEPGRDGAAYGIAAVGALAVPIAFVSMIECVHLPQEGVRWALLVILGAKLNDIGGYVIGSTAGRHRLCPGISPNKTVEGALGGLLLGIVGTIAITHFFDDGPGRLDALRAGILGLALGLTTQVSDLFESALKRSAGVKDSGRVIPAFGGILDLVDSLIFAAPVGYTLGVLWRTG